LYLEGKDFRALLKDWNSSQEKRLWLASDNYDVFSRSNLYLKLQNAQAEFSAAAGLPPNMAPNMGLLDGIAGSESALALYDIGDLQFLYITKLPTAKFAESALWKVRGSYQPRKSAGLDYYVRIDRSSKRVAAFAAVQDYLLLATREDALAAALALLSGQSAPNLTQEPWYSKSIESAKQPGELRMVLNIPRLLESPYMRSYWIQRNASELRQFSSAISEVQRTGTQLDENRILFRGDEQPVTWKEPGVAQLVALVPPNAGFYQAWASPTSSQALDLLRTKVFEPRAEATLNTKAAPDAGSMDVIVGSEGDLETRIDETPIDQGRRSSLPDELNRRIESQSLDGMMQVSSTRILTDRTFVGMDSAVVLLAASDWNAAAIKAATSRLAGGLPQVHIAVSGKFLAAANRPELLGFLISRATIPAAGPGARYVARFRHAAELPNFIRMTRLIDNPLKADGPAFFSGNIASLGRTLGRLDSAAIAVHDTGSVVSQELSYRWKP
jgi:hypothetical protein